MGGKNSAEQPQEPKCECADLRKDIRELWDTFGRVEDRLDCRIDKMVDDLDAGIDRQGHNMRVIALDTVKIIEGHTKEDVQPKKPRKMCSFYALAGECLHEGFRCWQDAYVIPSRAIHGGFLALQW